MKIEIRIIEIAKGCFRGDCPNLPGCMTIGRSSEEVRQRMIEQVRSYLASLDASCMDYVELVVVGSASTKHSVGCLPQQIGLIMPAEKRPVALGS